MKAYQYYFDGLFFYDILMCKKIIIQGVKGSFHDIAMRHFYKDNASVDFVVADSFPELFEDFTVDKTIDHAIIAIENTIAGSIMYNYTLLKQHSFHITGEIFLRIKHNLMALPGTRIEDILEVHSHPMALAQCKTFLGKHKHWQKIEREDTALCAAEIGLRRKKNFAAIASELAAKEYGLDILEESIETNKQNFTRFLILSREKNEVDKVKGREKASICFSLKHEAGSLHVLLGMLAERSCNLTKIQSSPIIGKEFQYFFFVDFILEANSFSEIVQALEKHVESLQILGHYNEGLFYES